MNKAGSKLLVLALALSAWLPELPGSDEVGTRRRARVASFAAAQPAPQAAAEAVGTPAQPAPGKEPIGDKTERKGKGLRLRLCEQLDRFHENLYRRLDRPMCKLDSHFAPRGEPLAPAEGSAFRVRYMVDITHDTNEDVDIDADVHLPNLEKRFHLFLRRLAPSVLPGTDPNSPVAGEKKKNWFLGLRFPFLPKNMDIELKSGIKLHNPPVAFVEAEQAYCWQKSSWSISPSQSVFWLSDDGFGEKTSLWACKWLTERHALSSVSSARFTEVSIGLEWNQVIMLGYVIKGNKKSAESSIGLRASIFGHHYHEGDVDLYRLDLPLRIPLYRRWIYLQLTPRVDWPYEDDWHREYGFTIELETLFHGTAER